MARYEPSRLDLHCLQIYLYWSTVMKVLTHLETNDSGEQSFGFQLYLTERDKLVLMFAQV